MTIRDQHIAYADDIRLWIGTQRHKREELRSFVPLATHHRHPAAVEIQVIHHGEGHYYIRDRLYPIRPRTVGLIRCGDPHNFVPSTVGGSIYKTSLIFAPDFVEAPADSELARRLLSGASNCPCQLHLDGTEAAQLDQLLALLQDETAARKPCYREAIQGYLVQLLIVLERAWRDRRTGPHGEVADSQLVANLLAVIDEQYRQPLDLTMVAEKVGRSPWYVSRLVPAATGLTFVEYLNVRRVVEAKRLLDAGDGRKMTAVCADCGFTSISSFNRAFRRVTGMPPSRYRDVARQARTR